MKPLITLLILSGLYLPSFAAAEDTYINAAETIAFGVFTSGPTTTRSSPATKDAPPRDSVSRYRFEDFTTDIPMILGTQFGLEYQINTQPSGRPIDITTIIRFPEPGIVQPRGRTYLRSKETSRINIGEAHLHGYGFDETWELVSGEWVFEVWYRKALLISKTFNVYVPDTPAETVPLD